MIHLKTLSLILIGIVVCTGCASAPGRKSPDSLPVEDTGITETDSSAAEEDSAEKTGEKANLLAKQAHPLYGYGSAKGAVEQMARLQARQMAELDVANQLAGKPFTFKRKDDFIEIKTRLNLQVPGVRVVAEYRLEKNHYCAIVQTAAMVDVRGKKNVFNKEFTVSIHELAANLRMMEMETIRDAVDRIDPGAKQANGKIYFSGLSPLEGEGTTEAMFRCVFSVVVDALVKK